MVRVLGIYQGGRVGGLAVMRYMRKGVYDDVKLLRWRCWCVFISYFVLYEFCLLHISYWMSFLQIDWALHDPVGV